MSSKYVPQTFPDTVLCDRCGCNYISTLPAIEPPVFSNSLSSVDKTVMHSNVERALARVTYVARIRIPEVIPFVGRVCCWFSPLFPCVFSANNVVFPFPQKGTLAIPNSKWCWEMKSYFVNMVPSFKVIYLLFFITRPRPCSKEN